MPRLNVVVKFVALVPQRAAPPVVPPAFVAVTKT
jgi:hypothetical protein